MRTDFRHALQEIYIPLTCIKMMCYAVRMLNAVTQVTSLRLMTCTISLHLAYLKQQLLALLRQRKSHIFQVSGSLVWIRSGCSKCCKWCFPVELWHAWNKPRSGPIFQLKQRARAAYKYAIRCCRRHEQKTKANAMVADLASHDFQSCWKKVSAIKKPFTASASNVGTASGPTAVCDIWFHYYSLPHSLVQFSPLPSPSHRAALTRRLAASLRQNMSSSARVENPAQLVYPVSPIPQR